MKSPVFPIFARRFILATVLVATAGCSFLKRRDHTEIGKPPPPETPVPGATPPPFAEVDKKFMATAARIFAYHRRMGALARQYGSSETARSLGGLMEAEMAVATDNLKLLVNNKQQQKIVSYDAGNWGGGGLGRLGRPGSEGFDRQFYHELKLSGTLGFETFDHAFRTVVDLNVKDFVKQWYPILRNYPREAIKAETDLDVRRK